MTRTNVSIALAIMWRKRVCPLIISAFDIYVEVVNESVTHPRMLLVEHYVISWYLRPSVFITPLNIGLPSVPACSNLNYIIKFSYIL